MSLLVEEHSIKYVEIKYHYKKKKKKKYYDNPLKIYIFINVGNMICHYKIKIIKSLGTQFK